MSLLANDIRKSLIEYLKVAYPDWRILAPEFYIGQVLSDLVLITDSALYAFEIKSDSDSWKRWAHQRKAYSAVFSFNTLVVGEKKLQEVFKKKVFYEGGLMRDYSWGLLLANEGGIYSHQNSTFNPYQAPYRVLSILWKGELRRCLYELIGHDMRKARSLDRIKKIAELLPLPKIVGLVCKRLYERAESGKWWKNGVMFAPIPGRLLISEVKKWPIISMGN